MNLRWDKVKEPLRWDEILKELEEDEMADDSYSMFDSFALAESLEEGGREN